jgi:hypothetical protein
VEFILSCKTGAAGAVDVGVLLLVGVELEVTETIVLLDEVGAVPPAKGKGWEAILVAAG